MRQVGILAAAGSFALEQQRRAARGGSRQRAPARRAASPGRRGWSVDLDRVETNIVVFELADDAPDAATVVARARERGVLVFAFGPRTIRAVTHLDVDREACLRGAEILSDSVG